MTCSANPIDRGDAFGLDEIIEWAAWVDHTEGTEASAGDKSICVAHAILEAVEQYEQNAHFTGPNGLEENAMTEPTTQAAHSGTCQSDCSVCHAKLGHHDDPRPHHCLLPAGHEGRHFCHICGLYWDIPDVTGDRAETRSEDV